MPKGFEKAFFAKMFWAQYILRISSEKDICFYRRRDVFSQLIPKKANSPQSKTEIPRKTFQKRHQRNLASLFAIMRQDGASVRFCVHSISQT